MTQLSTWDSKLITRMSSTLRNSFQSWLKDFVLLKMDPRKLRELPCIFKSIFNRLQAIFKVVKDKKDQLRLCSMHSEIWKKDASGMNNQRWRVLFKVSFRHSLTHVLKCQRMVLRNQLRESTYEQELVGFTEDLEHLISQMIKLISKLL